MNRVPPRTRWSFVGTLLFLVSACSPSPAALEKTLKAHPEIVFSAIAASPERFVVVATEATATARAAEKLRSLDGQFQKPKSPALTADTPHEGPDDAKVAIVEYSDLQCPYCRRAYNTIVELRKAYPNDVKVYFKQMPLDIHKGAIPAAKMFLAIYRQDPSKAIQFRGFVFMRQDQLNAKGEAFLREAAKLVGADVPRAMRDAERPDIAASVASDLAESLRFGFNGTPSYLINGVALEGARPIGDFRAVIDRVLNK